MRLVIALLLTPLFTALAAALVVGVAMVVTGESLQDLGNLFEVAVFAFIGAGLVSAIAAVLIWLPLFLVFRKLDLLSIWSFVFAGFVASAVLWMVVKGVSGPYRLSDIAIYVVPGQIGGIFFGAVASGRLTLRSSGRPGFARPPLSS